MNICCFILLTIIQIDLSSLTIIVSSLPPFGWSQMETKNFEILLTRKKKVSVRGEAIWMIYVAIRKVICSLDLAASSLQGWGQSKIISKHGVVLQPGKKTTNPEMQIPFPAF